MACVVVNEYKLVHDESVLHERRGKVQQEEEVDGRLLPRAIGGHRAQQAEVQEQAERHHQAVEGKKHCTKTQFSNKNFVRL
jgi:hypothetical protein